MRLSISTYSYSKLMESGKLTQLDCIAKSKELGFDQVEIESLHHAEDISDEEYARLLREESERQGMPISNFTFGADLFNAFDGDSKREIERVKHMIDLAEMMGARSVRHDATVGPQVSMVKENSFRKLLPMLAESCREITEYAAAKGIRTMVENHGYFCQDSDRVEALVNAVDHPNFGLLVDMGNFCCADEDPAVAVGRVAPYAFYAHAKDFHIKSAMEPNPGEGFFRSRNGSYLRGAIIGHGDVPVKHCLAALKRAGFDGTIALEFEGMENPITAIAIGAANVRRYWNELGEL